MGTMDKSANEGEGQGVGLHEKAPTTAELTKEGENGIALTDADINIGPAPRNG